MTRPTRFMVPGLVWLSVACAGLRPSADPGNDQRVVAKAPATQPVSDEEAAEAALAFVVALVEQDEAAFMELCDFEAGLLFAAEGLSLPAGLIEGASEAVAPLERATLHASGGMSEGVARPLAVERLDGEVWVSVRLIVGQAIFEHYHLRVVKLPAGPRVVDVWTLMAPVPRNRSVRDGLVAVFGGGQMDLEAFELAKLKVAMNERLAAKDGEGLLRMYDAAPAAFRESFEGQVFRIAGARLIAQSDLDRSRAISLEFIAAFPTSPAAHKRAYLLATSDGDGGAAATALEALFETSSSDPYLLALASVNRVDAEQLDPARALAERAVVLEPDLSEAWEALLIVAEAQRDGPAARRALDAVAGFGVTPSSLREDPAWAALVAMPAFAEWEASLAAP